jgi:hypothetical protein
MDAMDDNQVALKAEAAKHADHKHIPRLIQTMKRIATLGIPVIYPHPRMPAIYPHPRIPTMDTQFQKHDG